MTTVTAQEFNREPSRVKAKAKDGPVFITDHGTRSHVLLTIEEYERIRPSEYGLGTRLWAAARDLGLHDNPEYDDYDLDPGSEYWAGVDESGDFPDFGRD